MLLMGAEIGLVNPTVSGAAIGVVPAAKAATGAAINNTFRQVGVAVGIAALGAVFQGRVESKLGDLLATRPPALQAQAGELAPAVSSGNAEAAVAAAPPEAQAFLADAAREAFLSGLNAIFLIAGVAALIGGALSLVLIRARDLQLDSHEESAVVPEPAAGDEQPARLNTWGSPRAPPRSAQVQLPSSEE
jgi:hypothetical protein